MTNKTYKILAILAMFLFLTSGCLKEKKQLTAEEIRDKSIEAMKNVKSYEFDMVMQLTPKNEPTQSIDLHARGKINKEARKAYMLMSMKAMGTSMEMETYIIGNEQYIKLPMLGWVKNETSEHIWEKLEPKTTLLEDVKVNLIGTEEVDNEECYILETKPDIEKVLEMTQQIGEGKSADAIKFVKNIEAKEWISKKTFLVKKTVVNMEMEKEGQSADVSITMRVYNYNKPMNIELPEEAKNAIDIKSGTLPAMGS